MKQQRTAVVSCYAPCGALGALAFVFSLACIDPLLTPLTAALGGACMTSAVARVLQPNPETEGDYGLPEVIQQYTTLYPLEDLTAAAERMSAALGVRTQVRHPPLTHSCCLPPVFDLFGLQSELQEPPTTQPASGVSTKCC